MGQYLIDNNVISNYFSGFFSEPAMVFIGELVDNIPNISVITEIEALSWVNRDKSKEKIVQDFIKECNILTISPDIVHQCVRIRRSRKMKTPDAIIAATAIVNGLSLVTDDQGFAGINGLKTINPISL